MPSQNIKLQATDTSKLVLFVFKDDYQMVGTYKGFGKFIHAEELFRLKSAAGKIKMSHESYTLIRSYRRSRLIGISHDAP